jgi:signal transduction histidine kinase
MNTLKKTPDLPSRLQAFEVFHAIDIEALEWLVERSEYYLYDRGELFFKPGQAIDHMQVIVEGRYVVHFVQNGERREYGVWETGHVTGVLPFSRMKIVQAYGTALDPCYVLELHKKHFTEMVNVSYSLTEALVQTMTSRVRDYTQLRFQDEKLMALGKLSAGLAHELNNPASAIVRSSEELYKKIHATPEKFKSIITMRITPEQTDRVNAILFSKLENVNGLDLPLLQRERLKDDVVDWLEDNGVDDGEDIAETFVDFGLNVGELEQIAEIIHGESIGAIMWWVESTLSLEKLVARIRESADRISNLVQSVKTYSHMDRGVSMEPVDIHEGIRSTLTMLNHKLKGKNIQVVKNFDGQLPKVNAYAGELNQVWTNLIVNAVDAMDQDGVLTIDTYPEREYVCVDISDTGKGIPEENLTRIFEPFFTTKALGEGTGMGLDIVKKIMDRHKGDINVESVPGKTKFMLCFH